MPETRTTWGAVTEKQGVSLVWMCKCEKPFECRDVEQIEKSSRLELERMD